jgi:hypothetical protein
MSAVRRSSFPVIITMLLYGSSEVFMGCWYYHTKKSQKGSYFPFFLSARAAASYSDRGKIHFCDSAKKMLIKFS